MGTRSVVAVRNGDGFKGRYIHWDGYPTGVGQTLLDIVRRDGLEKAVKTLTQDHYGWSNLDDTTSTDEPLGLGMTDGRFVKVDGYGTAYTTEQNQSNPEDWITDDGDDFGTEWAYILGERGIDVCERRWKDDGTHMTGAFGQGAGVDGGYWFLHGHVPYEGGSMEAIG